MKIFIPSTKKLSREVTERISKDGYDEIVYETDVSGMRESVRQLSMCDAMLVSDSKQSSTMDKTLRTIAAMCGLEIIYEDSYRIADEVFSAVTKYYGVSAGAVRSSKRSGKLVDARKMIAHIMYGYNISMKRIVKYLGHERTVVYYYIKSIRREMEVSRKLREDKEKILEAITKK